MDTSHLNEQFQENGYVIVEDLFDPKLVEACDKALFEHYGVPREMHLAENFKGAECEVVSWNPVGEGSVPFVRVANDKGFAETTRAVLGGDFDHMNGSLVMYSAPQTIGQAWHQDCPITNREHFNLNRLLYTHDIGEHGGEIVLVPGSHRGEILPTGEPHGDLPGQITLAPKAGTVVFLHGMTYHRVRPVGDRPRISSNFRVVPKGAPTDITNVATYRNMIYRFSTQEILDTRD